MATKIQIKRGQKENMPILESGELAFALDEKKVYVGTGEENIPVSGVIDEELSGESENAVKSKAIKAYVDSKSGGIATIKVNGTAQEIVDSAVDLSVPTKMSQLTNDSGYLKEHPDVSEKADKTYVDAQDNTNLTEAKAYADIAVANKVSAEPGMGLSANDYTDADKAKVDTALISGGTVTVDGLPSLPAGPNKIGSVSVDNFPATQASNWTAQKITNLETKIDSIISKLGATSTKNKKTFGLSFDKDNFTGTESITITPSSNHYFSCIRAVKNNTDMSLDFSMINQNGDDFFKKYTIMGGNPEKIRLDIGESVENIEGMFKSFTIYMPKGSSFEGNGYVFFEETEV